MSYRIIHKYSCPRLQELKLASNGGNSTRGYLLSSRLEVLLCLHVRGHAVECERIDRSIRISKDHFSQALFSPLGEGGQVASTVLREPNLVQHFALLRFMLRENVFAGYGKRIFG